MNYEYVRLLKWQRITMYLGLLLGLKFSLHAGIGQSYEHFSYILAIGLFVLVYIFFKNRK